MKRNIAIIIALMVLCLFVEKSNAAVVDLIRTAGNYSNDRGGTMISGPSSLSKGIQISFADPVNITSIWVASKIYWPYSGLTDDNVRYSIWTDVAGLPGSMLPGYQTSNIPITSGTYTYNYWTPATSASPLDWRLAAGTNYWLVVDGVGVTTQHVLLAGPASEEEQYLQHYCATCPGNAYPTLTTYATYDGSAWEGASAYDLALGIKGEIVPVPATVWLLGSGLIGLVGIRKKIIK